MKTGRDYLTHLSSSSISFMLPSRAAIFVRK
jgi:hypothetical protein